MRRLIFLSGLSMLAFLPFMSFAAEAPAVGMLKLSGFAQAQVVNDQALINKQTYFTLKRARIIAAGNVTDKIGLFSQVEMFTDKINILDLVIDYNLDSFGKIGLGRFTIPFGLQNTVSPFNLNTINYAQVVQKLVGSGGRDFGLRWTGKYKIADWSLAVINGADGGTTVNSTTDDNNVKDLAVRLGVMPITGLGIGVSVYAGEAGALEVTKERLDADVKYDVDKIYAQGEYISGKDDVIKKAGYYLEAGYKFGALQPMIRYDVYDGNTDMEDASEIKIFALGANYYLTPNAKVQLIYEIKDDKLGVDFGDIDNNAAIMQVAVKF